MVEKVPCWAEMVEGVVAGLESAYALMMSAARLAAPTTPRQMKMRLFFSDI